MEFEANRNALYCPDCRKIHAREYQRERRNTVTEIRTCVICGNEYVAKKYRQGVTCSNQCRNAFITRRLNELNREKTCNKKPEPAKKPKKHKSQIVEKCAEAGRRGVSYGDIQAEITLAEVGKIDVEAILSEMK
ncbi:hypothetical protein ACPW7J_02080 [Ihubacter sp. rT4E-8]|uniref:hypothetical protein n=1 Tax=Ihubacter sp. rT4E-8 TaxID=3242369 RepID=UPI003CF555F8